MRPYLLPSSIALATAVTFAIPARDAFAQRRHHRGSGSSTTSTTTNATSTTTTAPATDSTPASNATATSTTSTSASSTTSATAATSAPAEPAHGSDSGHSESHGHLAAAAANAEPEVLISNVIDRPGYHRTRVEGEIFGSVGPGAWAWPWGGFILSAGIRGSFPLTQNGPIARMNNDFRFIFGAQAYFSITPQIYWWVSAPISLQWNFYISEQWSVLLEAGLAVDVFVYDFLNCYDHPQLYCDRIFFHPLGAFGLRRHLGSAGSPGAPSVSFRFQYPGGVQVALGF